MTFARNLVVGFFITNSVLFASDAHFNELLKCNLRHDDVSSLCDVQQEIHLYNQALQNESNYESTPKLEQWVDDYFYPQYPNLHVNNQLILDAIKELNLISVCEVGAGAGKICKYIYAENPHLAITCIEHNSSHLQQMEENFHTRPHVILPNISVPATILKGALPDLHSIPADTFDLVFTCTVMMHIPFIPAVQSAMEIARLSKKYIIHVENKNFGTEWYDMTIVKPASMSPINYQGIDYVKLYEKLGVKTLKYFEYKDPCTPGTFIFYLGEKN